MHDVLISGIADMLEAETKAGVTKATGRDGVPPVLGLVVRPDADGGHSADLAFCRSLERQARHLGIDTVRAECPYGDDAVASVAGLIADGRASGIAVLSDYGEETNRMLSEGIPARMDIDAEGNARTKGAIPCVAQAAVGLLAEAFAKRYAELRFREWEPGAAWHGTYDMSTHDVLDGKDVLVLGRSKDVGLPIACELICRGASVGVLSSRSVTGPWTQERGEYVLPTDQLLWDGIVSCVGRARRWDDVNLTRMQSDAVLVDVGTSVEMGKDGKSHLTGDFSPSLDGHVGYRSPVPGGVGLLTTLELLRRVACGNDC